MSAGPRLFHLAGLLDIATEFWDWKGRHTKVSEDTIIKVMAAMGVQATTPEQVEAAIAEHSLKPWRRSLPPVVVVPEGEQTHVEVHVVHGTLPRSGCAPRPARCATSQRQHLVPPREIDGVLIGEASFQIARPAHRLPPAGAAVGRPAGRRHLIVTPSSRAARAAGQPAGVGLRRPALQPAIAGLLGDRRPGRPVRPGGLVGHPAVRPLRADQPAARRPTGAADGRLALPARLPAVPEPDVHPAGGGPRVRLPGPDPACRGGRAAGPAGRRTGRRRPGAARPVLAVQAAGAAGHSPGRVATGPPDGLRRLPAQAGTPAAYSPPGACSASTSATTGGSGTTTCSGPRSAGRQLRSDYSHEIAFHEWLWVAWEQLSVPQQSPPTPAWRSA